MWHSPREGPKGHSVWLLGHKAYFEGGFRLDLRDTWHSPKLCSERGCEGDFEGWLPGHVAFSEGWSGRGSDGGFEGAFGRASGRLRKGLSVGLRGHVSDSEKAPKWSSGRVGSKGFPKGGLSARFSSLD